MSQQRKVTSYKTLRGLVSRLRDDFKQSDFVILYAYNGTCKTRLSMEFKDKGKTKVTSQLTDESGNALVDDKGRPLTTKSIVPDTLYFNAFTEDLFTWDNDLENDSDRVLKMNPDSNFLKGFKELALEERIANYLQRYAKFDFDIDYEKWTIAFSKLVKNPKYREGSPLPETITEENIKVSRGEQNIFIWCIFMSICELVLDGAEAYDWVKYLYIDDPISSLDDNNAIAVATDLTKLLLKGKDELGDFRIKTVISSHHSLFYNVVCNELKKESRKQYFLYRGKDDTFSIQTTEDTPFFHHVATLSELKTASDNGEVFTHHFNALRGILEKTSVFFGYNDFSDCIHGIEDEALFTRALNLLSHGRYSLYQPQKMGDDTKDLFTKILNGFLDRNKFSLPKLLDK